MLISGITGIDLTGLPINNSGNAEVEGNLNFTGVGNRITGDFSNATTSNRAAFQTSTINGNTTLGILPNGTGIQSLVQAFSNSDISNSGYIGIAHNSSTGAYINSGYTGSGTVMPLLFMIGGAEKMRIDTAGNICVGVTPSAWGSPFIKAIETNGGAIVSNGTNNMEFWQNAYYNGSQAIYRNTGVVTGRYAISNGHIWYNAPSGTAGNPITWTNAMTLDTSGNLLVGADSALNPNYGVSVRNVGGTIGQTIMGHATGTASSSAYTYFMYAGSTIGSITQSGTTAIAYNTTSDYRLKENIRPSDCKRFMDIKFVDYERIDGRHECGVIAHELQEVYPDLVTGEKDAVETRKVELTPAVEEVKDEDGNVIVEAIEATYEEQEFPVYQQVNYIGLIARIGTVVQQQAKLIEELRLEVEILKGAK